MRRRALRANAGTGTCTGTSLQTAADNHKMTVIGFHYISG